MNRISTVLTLTLSAAALLLTACSSTTTVLVPPQMDLESYGTMGMIEFTSNGSDDVRRDASREFLAAIHSAQPGIPVLELGEEHRVLEAVRGDNLDPETIRAIGEKYHVDILVFGILDAQEVRPQISIGSSIESLKAKAEIQGSLNAKMYDTRSGATLWTSTASGKETVATLDVSAGLAGLGGSHPDDAHDRLVRALVARATRDFRPSYVRQRVQ